MTEQQDRKLCPMRYSPPLPSKSLMWAEMKGESQYCRENLCAWWTGRECIILMAAWALKSLVGHFN